MTHFTHKIRAMELVIAADVIHCDLKANNWLVLAPDGEETEDDVANGGHGVMLIDFGRSLDRRHFCSSTRFLGRRRQKYAPTSPSLRCT